MPLLVAINTSPKPHYNVVYELLGSGELLDVKWYLALTVW
jgi:hypothetical protein